jgi:hypothetical protein
MPPLTDPLILGQFQAVLANWKYTGYVTAKEVALAWIADELSGLSLKDVAKAMHKFLTGGGIIDQVQETRPEWSAWPFHYDFRFSIGDRDVYMEVLLQDDDPSDPTIHIVSIHDA